jgi:outer membrane receptor protein involved in Fe transport
MFNDFRVSILASSFLMGVAGIATQVQAQDAPSASGETIVVTGTLIRNSNVAAATPVQVTGREEISLRAANTAEQLLRGLPGVAPSIGNAVNIGNPGFSFVDLRGLGANRNVVLLDGQRITPSDTLGRVDLNNIPLALIERVENLTGGASTTYGADAVSGVVNFITRTDIHGLEVNASNQVDEKGDGRYSRVDATLGHNFAGGRGNIVIAGGYQKAQAVYQGDRSYGKQAIDSFSGQPSGSYTTNPALFFLLGNLGATQGVAQVVPATRGFTDDVSLFNYAPYNLFQLPFERYNAFASTNYEVTDRIKFYARGLYSHNLAKTVVAPSGVAGSSVTIPISNPFLSDEQRSLFCTDGGLSAAQCGAAAVATNPNDPNFRTVDEALLYRSVGLGPRIDTLKTEVYDFRAGFKGAITDRISFDVSGGYGKSVNSRSEQGYMSLSRTRDALMATNSSTCLSGNPGCVPLDIFGPSSDFTPAMADYVGVSAFSQTKASLAQVQGTISGDFGVASPLAVKPINFAIGASYRKYKASQNGDQYKTTLDELGLDSVVIPFKGGYDVAEVYGETIAPLVEGRPFVRNLAVEAGIRYSRYKIDTAGNPKFETTTWKGGGSWTPVDGVKLRGMFQHAVRAPNIYELFLPDTPAYADLAIDPCAGSNPVGNANLTAICIAQGAPANRIGGISQPSGGEISSTTYGSTSLKPEKANSITLGLVLTPRELIPGFTLTVDYFHIRIKDAIASATPFDVINACFGNITAASAGSAACQAISRNPASGQLDGGDQSKGILQPLTNDGRLLTDGIDLNASYRKKLGAGTLNLGFSGTWTHRARFKASPTSIDRECVGYYSANCGTPAAPERGSLQPAYVWNQRTSYAIGAFDVSLLWRHLSSMRYEPVAVATTGAPYGDFGRIKAYNYFDATVQVDATSALQLTFTVQNLGNRKPPFVGSSIGYGVYNSGNTYPSTYDTLGRRYGVSARMRF